MRNALTEKNMDEKDLKIGSFPREAAPTGSSPTNDSNGEEAIEQIALYRKKRVIIPLSIVVIIGAVALWYWYMNLRGFNSTDDAYIDADRVVLSSKILGRISQLTAGEGDTVVIGQIIVRLDDSDLRAQEQQSRAAVNSAQQNVTLAKVNLDKAIMDFQRADKQYRDKVIPQEQFDHAQKAREAAEAQYAVALAQVEAAKAQLAVIQTNLQNTVIASPLSGEVAKRWVLVGDVIQPAQPIFSIYNLDSVWVTANFEETKLSTLRVGDQVEITVDSYPAHEFRGKVFQLGSYTAAQFSLIPPNNASGNFTKVTQRVPVKISIENPSSQRTPLLPGMSVEVKVRVK